MNGLLVHDNGGGLVGHDGMMSPEAIATARLIGSWVENTDVESCPSLTRKDGNVTDTAGGLKLGGVNKPNTRPKRSISNYGKQRQLATLMRVQHSLP